MELLLTILMLMSQLLAEVNSATTLCSATLNPLIDQGVIVDNVCYQTSRPGQAVYDKGKLSAELKVYLDNYTYYPGPERYIELGQGWYYDTETHDMSIAPPKKSNEVRRLNMLYSNYHIYIEDRTKTPKHFVHVGKYYNGHVCCKHWQQINFMQ